MFHLLYRYIEESINVSTSSLFMRPFKWFIAIISVKRAVFRKSLTEFNMLNVDVCYIAKLYVFCIYNRVTCNNVMYAREFLFNVFFIYITHSYWVIRYFTGQHQSNIKIRKKISLKWIYIELLANWIFFVNWQLFFVCYVVILFF